MKLLRLIPLLIFIVVLSSCEEPLKDYTEELQRLDIEVTQNIIDNGTFKITQKLALNMLINDSSAPALRSEVICIYSFL